MYLQNVQDAEEVVQDTALKVLQSIMDDSRKSSQFRGEASFKTWVYRIAINRSKDYLKYRNQKKRKAVIYSLAGQKLNVADELIPENAPNPDEQLESKEAITKIWQAIDRLPTTQKEVLVLVKLESIPVKQAATVLDTTPKAVESLLSRAKANLKKYLANK